MNSSIFQTNGDSFYAIPCAIINFWATKLQKFFHQKPKISIQRFRRNSLNARKCYWKIQDELHCIYNVRRIDQWSFYWQHFILVEICFTDAVVGNCVFSPSQRCLKNTKILQLLQIHGKQTTSDWYMESFLQHVK